MTHSEVSADHLPIWDNLHSFNWPAVDTALGEIVNYIRFTFRALGISCPLASGPHHITEAIENFRPRIFVLPVFIHVHLRGSIESWTKTSVTYCLVTVG